MAQYVYTMNRVSKIVPPKREILKDISLSFFPGAKIGVLGLNGAGKSTLLQMLAGITEPTSGRLSISGKVTAVGTGCKRQRRGTVSLERCKNHGAAARRRRINGESGRCERRHGWSGAGMPRGLGEVVPLLRHCAFAILPGTAGISEVRQSAFARAASRCCFPLLMGVPGHT